MQRVEKVLERVSELPFSPVAAKILELAQDERAGAREIAKVIAQDQAFTARLLKIANSPYYGQTRAVITVAQAVPVLGVDTISSLALALFSFGSLSHGEGAILSLRELWEHSIGCGLWGRHMAKRIGHPATEEAFIAGLLHDMGKALYYRFFKNEFLEAVTLAQTENMSLAAAERHVLGMDHAAAGAVVARKWHLPPLLMHTIEFHHDPFSVPEEVSESHRKTIAIVHVADMLGDAFNIGRGIEADPAMISEDVWNFLGLEANDCSELLETITTEVTEFRKIFDISAAITKAAVKRQGSPSPSTTAVRKAPAPAERSQTQGATNLAGSHLADFARMMEAGKQLALLAGLEEVYPNIAIHAAALLNADAAHVLIPSGTALRVVGASGAAPLKKQAVPVDGSLAGWVSKMGETMVIPDITRSATASWEKAFFAQAGYRAHLFFPVECAGKRLAVLCVHNVAVRQWTAQEISLFTTFIGLAAVALENARLYREAEDRATSLAELNKKLEQALHVKTRFLATVSHELRSPLFVITGYAGVLSEQMLGPIASPVADVLQKIKQQADALTTLITHILEISQIDSGTFALQRRSFDVIGLLDEVAGDVPKLLNGKPVVFTTDYDKQPYLIVSDYRRVKQVLNHLLENAAKFTHRGKIVLRAAASERGVTITIEDTGIGIDPAHQELIFEGFRQVEDEDNRRYDGLGLGLYLSRSLLGILGGTIRVESNAGEGSRFHVWLPRRASNGTGDLKCA
jgi:putative nucleotidyltransferase with HDIG domain